MVALSLRHRVKMDQQAAIMDDKELREGPRRRILFLLVAMITVVNVAFVGIGAALAAIIDHFPLHQLELFFFYCSIPLFLSALSAYETIQLGRRSASHGSLLRITSASLGLALWLFQLCSEQTCTWYAVHGDQSFFCPASFGQALSLDTGTHWSTEITMALAVACLTAVSVLLYMAYLVLAIRGYRAQREKVPIDRPVPRFYSYRGVDVDPELQTDRDIPELNISDADAEAKDRGRPPSYHSGSHFAEDLDEASPAEKARQMV